MKTLFILVAILVFTACRITPNDLENNHPSEMKLNSFEIDPLGLKLTTQGNNIEATFSPDGNKICFVSNSRFSHKNRQLYELTLSTRVERRVSFSDGDVFLPVYSSLGDVIIYSSTTDEIKERPILFYPNKYQNRVPKDLYTSDPFGKQIQRILNLEGSQADLHHLNGSGDEYTFISSNDDQSKIMIFNFRNKTERVLKTFAKIEPTRPLANMKGEVFWLEDGRIKKIQSGKEIQTLKIPLQVLDLEWATAEKNIILFLAKNDQQESVVSVLRVKQNCIAVVLKTSRKITSADYSEKGNKLLLTVDDDEKNNIFVQELKASNLEAFSCESLE